MKVLMLTDRYGNGDTCSLLVPDGMNAWNVSSFMEFLAAGSQRASELGFLPRAPGSLRFEPFRQLVMFPEATYNRPVVFEQDGHVLGTDDSIDLKAPMNRLMLDRADGAGPPDSRRISVADCNRHAFAANRREIVAAIDGIFDFEAYPVTMTDSRRMESFDDLVDCFGDGLDAANKVRLLFRMAQLIHAAPFENFSKIIAGRQFRSGYEMWGNLQEGFGGVCAEKTAALRFVCDVLSIPFRPVLGCDSVIPDHFEQSLRVYVDSEGQGELPVHVHHHLLQIAIDSEEYLVDVTNGNVPLSFLDRRDAERRLRHGYRARMVYRVERLHLRRTSTWAGDALLTLSGYHVPELHLQYVFEQGLGLHISADTYVGVYFDWGGEVSALKQNYYSALARRVGFPYPRFIHENNLSSVPNPGLEELLRKTLDALRHQYQDRHYTGDFTFVIQPLAPHFWTMPRVSASVKRLLPKELSSGRGRLEEPAEAR